MNQSQLSAPKRYFPLEKGLYEVAPGLKNFTAENRVFEIDSEFSIYRENKMRCREERLSKYHLTSNLSARVSSNVNRFIVERLLLEHPELFVWEQHARGGVLVSSLTGDRIPLGADYELTESLPPYHSAFDALCCQIQEDFAVMSREGERDWLSAIHLCSPSHWAAEDKVGKNFFDIHVPVPGIEKLNRAAASFVDAMIRKGPYFRFVWGFGSDRRLNHHPTPPSGVSGAEWKGRTFMPDAAAAGQSPFILRVERQVLFGLPEVDAGIFTIRVSFIDGEEIRRDPVQRELLRSALLSMTPPSRVYKGLDQCMDQVIAWLDKAN